ncbi:hypothetical protein AAHB41_09030 [Pediococcus pentosaceus]|uniref:hypothetical protein n=1 Tax=Pediococcus pentosaceus TaxID=1255 RepID=UPI002FEE9608
MIEDYMWNNNWIDQLLLSTLPLLELSKSVLFKIKARDLDLDKGLYCMFKTIDRQGNVTQQEFTAEASDYEEGYINITI